MGTTTLEIKPLPKMPGKDPVVQKFMQDIPELVSLNPVQYDWFYWTNYSRVNPRRFWDSVVAPLLVTFPPLKNSFSSSLKADLYKAPPLPMLRPNNSLQKVAGEHASELAKKKAGPSHTSPSGRTFEDRMVAAGIQSCAGENISFGPWDPVLMLTLLYIDEGVSNLGHRKSLLEPSYQEMGIGAGVYPDNRVLVVQDFACSQESGRVSRGTGR